MKLTTPSPSAVSINLDKGGVVDLQPTPEGIRVRVESGSLWVTQAGDRNDHVLCSGESFTAEGRGLVVVQALQNSAFCLA